MYRRQNYNTTSREYATWSCPKWVNWFLKRMTISEHRAGLILSITWGANLQLLWCQWTEQCSILWLIQHIVQRWDYTGAKINWTVIQVIIDRCTTPWKKLSFFTIIGLLATPCAFPIFKWIMSNEVMCLSITPILNYLNYSHHPVLGSIWCLLGFWGC